MIDNHLKFLVTFPPFVSRLKARWNELVTDGPDYDQELKNRIWTGIEDEIALRRYRRRRKWALTGVAAVCMAIMTAVSLWLWQPDSAVNDITYAQVKRSPTGAHDYRLPDGSVVWLENGSEISISENFLKDRRVSLTGNATFEVAKVEGKTFVVKLHGSEVIVKGTCFSIHESDEMSLTLYNGSVEFVPENGGAPVELKPSQRLTYVSATGEITVKDISSDLQWENGSYKFNQIELSELVEFMEKRYGVEISLAGNLGHCNLRMTGRLQYDEPLDSIIARICYVFKLECKSDGNRFVVTPTGE